MMRRLMKIALLGILGVLLVRTAAVPQPEGASLDHFECYKPALTKGATAFAPLAGVTLQDRIGPLTVDVKKPRAICNPVDKNGEDPTAPGHTEHLEAYQIKTSAGAPKFVPLLRQNVINQLGTVKVDLLKPVSLLVPSAKSLVAPPPAPVDPATDHFTCYKIKTTKGAPKFVAVSGVALNDQFGP